MKKRCSDWSSLTFDAETIALNFQQFEVPFTWGFGCCSSFAGLPFELAGAKLMASERGY